MSTYPTMKVSDELVTKIQQRATAALALSAGANQGADLSGWCGPVFDQQQEGSCTACTTRDFLLWLQNKYGYKLVVDPSVNALYYFARQIFGDLNTDGGSTVQDAFQSAITHGIIPTSDEVYSRDTLFSEPPMQDVAFKATSLQNLPANTASIRASLDNGTPVGVAVLVDQTLFTPGDTPDGIIGLVDVYTAVPNEAHAVLIVAYRTHPTYGYLYKFQNSWGAGYGDRGYAWFTEAYMTKNLFEVCTLDIPQTLAPPAPPAPIYPSEETDLVQRHHGIACNDDTYVPPELWSLVGPAQSAGSGSSVVNGKTYASAVQNGITYIHYQVMKDAGYALTRITNGWTFTK